MIDDRNSDTNAAALATANAAQAGAAGAFIVGSVLQDVGSWAVDVFRGLATIVRGSGADEMRVLERRMALADVLVLGAIADGTLDPSEISALRAYAVDNDELAREMEDAHTRWQAQPHVVADAAARALALTSALGKLDEAQREELTTRLRALPEDGPAGSVDPYREHATKAGSLRVELLSALERTGAATK